MDLAGVVLIGAAIAVIYGVYQLRLRRIIARNMWLLAIEERLDRYSHVDANLRPGGAWQGHWVDGRGPGPDSVAEWSDVEAYIGTFESVYDLYRDRVISIADVHDGFALRIGRVLASESIRAKLDGEREYWNKFLSLVTELDRYERKVAPTKRGLTGVRDLYGQSSE